MTSWLKREVDWLEIRVEKGDPLWPAQLAIAAAIAMNFGLTDRITLGPTLLAPVIEGVLLVALVVMTPARASELHSGRRRFALGVTGLVTLNNVVSLGLLVHHLLDGSHSGGHALIVSGVLLWSTSVLLFAVWFWELDGGGPATRHAHPRAIRDFQFPQMENRELAPPNWRPGFGDYLYTSLTNATAFSPTDTMPLTQRAKLLMGIQSVSAFVTFGLVVARAVNILG